MSPDRGRASSRGSMIRRWRFCDGCRGRQSELLLIPLPRQLPATSHADAPSSCVSAPNEPEFELKPEGCEPLLELARRRRVEQYRAIGVRDPILMWMRQWLFL